jgi:hypothetical protein
MYCLLMFALVLFHYTILGLWYCLVMEDIEMEAGGKSLKL